MRTPSSSVDPTAASARGVAAGIATFVLVVGSGWLAWPAIEDAFCTGFEYAATGVFGAHEFGHGGHVTLVHAQRHAVNTTERDASWDTSVRLRVDGVDQQHLVSVNPRRLAYLPMLFFTAFILAARLPWRRRGWCLAVGLPVLLLSALGSFWTIVVWLFSQVPGLVYDLGPTERAALRLLYEGYVTPIANKVIVPLLLAAALVLVEQARKPQAAVAPAAPSQSTAAKLRAQRRRRRRRG